MPVFTAYDRKGQVCKLTYRHGPRHNRVTERIDAVFNTDPPKEGVVLPEVSTDQKIVRANGMRLAVLACAQAGGGTVKADKPLSNGEQEWTVDGGGSFAPVTK